MPTSPPHPPQLQRQARERHQIRCTSRSRRRRRPMCMCRSGIRRSAGSSSAPAHQCMQTAGINLHPRWRHKKEWAFPCWLHQAFSNRFLFRGISASRASAVSAAVGKSSQAFHCLSQTLSPRPSGGPAAASVCLTANREPRLSASAAVLPRHRPSQPPARRRSHSGSASSRRD